MSYYTSGLLESATNIYTGTPYHLALGLNIPDPNAYSCTRSYGHPVLGACLTALSDLPYGTLPSIFTTRPHEPGSSFVTVPQRFVDSNQHPSCAITIDLDGQSTKDVFVSVPWDRIRNISKNIIDDCVGYRDIGGWETVGLKQAFDAVIDPSFARVDEDGSRPVGVVNPDGTIDSVGVPEGADQDPPTVEIPLYMIITVAAPRSRPTREITDFSISLNLREYLKQKFESNRKTDVQNAIARASKGLTHRFVSSLTTYRHPRWWHFHLGSETPELTNVAYDCDAKLGNPGLGNCENLLYEFVRGGNVVLDPDKGPTIKTSGNCAVGISSKEKQTVSWDMLRSVAETLIVTCVASPIAAAAGGKAMAKPIRAGPISGRRKRDGLSSSLPFTRRDTATASLPSSVELFVYLQPPFPGQADQTCPWKVASSHEGDVRQCPATSPFRPPERKLIANETVIHDGHITEVVNPTAVEVTNGNFTGIQAGNFTGHLKELASIPQAGVSSSAASVASVTSSFESHTASASLTSA